MRVLFFLLFSVVFSSCSKLTGLIPLEFDKNMGKQLSLQISENPSEYPVLDSVKYAPVYKYVEGIRDEILSSDKIKYKSEFPYTVKIIQDDSTLNAFAAPGGYIYVYTGLLKYV